MTVNGVENSNWFHKALEEMVRTQLELIEQALGVRPQFSRQTWQVRTICWRLPYEIRRVVRSENNPRVGRSLFLSWLTKKMKKLRMTEYRVHDERGDVLFGGYLESDKPGYLNSDRCPVDAEGRFDLRSIRFVSMISRHDFYGKAILCVLPLPKS